MRSILSINFIKYFFLSVVFAVLAMFFALNVRAQSASPAASPVPSGSPTADTSNETLDRLGVQFPIGDLGNCQDMGSCIKYCDDPVNFLSCEEYAKEKGFYKPEAIVVGNDPIWQQAKDDLGCESLESCADFCADEANHAKCDEFARKNQLEGGYTDNPDKLEYLEIAKDVLGCDSLDACANICDSAANVGKCTDFANRAGLLGGETREGPDGCISDNTCASYCSDPNNFEKCKSFASPGGNFAGPGGCDSPEACRTYCEENPDNCRSYAPGSNGRYVPISCPAGENFGPGGACTADDKLSEAGDCAQGGKYWDGDSCSSRAPDGIVAGRNSAYFQPRQDMGGCRTPGECYDYCRENAGKCGGFNAGSSRPTDNYVPYVYYTPGTGVKFEPKADFGGCDSPGKCYDYCRENAGKCQGFDEKSPRPLDTYVPGTYYTPPSNQAYFTPSFTNYYVTPVYFTPPAGSNYATPSYYTPGSYYTPSYYTPSGGSNYVTPNYYTPGSNYVTPTGSYPTPIYPTPVYYTPPIGSSYSTPSYYTPPPYNTPYYYSPSGSYTTPIYNTPPPYQTPSYYTPLCLSCSYSTPSYFTPTGSYTTPSYPTPNYQTPSYYYPSPTGGYSYPSPSGGGGYYYPTPSGGTYGTPYYNTPSTYSYPSPSGTGGGYYYPTPGSSYSYPSPSYVYPSPSGSGTSYYTPNSSYTYPSPTDGYVSPSYYSPYVTPSGSYSYPTPSGYAYPTPSSYSYPTPSYGTPEYPTPSYGTPSYSTPVQGATTGPVDTFIGWIMGFFK